MFLLLHHVRLIFDLSCRCVFCCVCLLIRFIVTLILILIILPTPLLTRADARVRSRETALLKPQLSVH